MSIGFFPVILMTGNTVASAATQNTDRNKDATCKKPALNSDTTKIPFNTAQSTKIPIVDNTKLIHAIIKLSIKQMNAISLRRAPNALNMPSSFFFESIETVKKFIKSNPEKTQNTIEIRTAYLEKGCAVRRYVPSAAAATGSATTQIPSEPSETTATTDFAPSEPSETANATDFAPF